jgi:hypothetical protein
MSYCFLKCVPAVEGHERVPVGHEGHGILLLADLPQVGWGLFDVDQDEGQAPEHPGTDELAGLIESGKRYPPALALARDEVRMVFVDHQPSIAEFAGAYEVAIRTHLSRQHEAPYVLAPALNYDAGSLTRGEWYWLLEVSGIPAVMTWVSADFHIHKNDVNDFDLTGRQLKRLGYSG